MIDYTKDTSEKIFNTLKKWALASITLPTMVFMSSTAIANNSFDGFYGQLAVGYGHEELSNAQVVSSAIGGVTLDQTKSNPRRTNFNSEIGLGYYKSVSNHFLLGIGASYSPQSQNLNTYTVASPGQPSLNGGYKTLNRYSLFLSPAFSVNDSGMAYLKLGYTGQTIKGYTGFLNSMPSQQQSGYIIGAGYKHLISNSVFIFGEANYVSYTKTNSTFSYGGNLLTVSPQVEAYNGLLGIGYRF